MTFSSTARLGRDDGETPAFSTSVAGGAVPHREEKIFFIGNVSIYNLYKEILVLSLATKGSSCSEPVLGFPQEAMSESFIVFEQPKKYLVAFPS